MSLKKCRKNDSGSNGLNLETQPLNMGKIISTRQFISYMLQENSLENSPNVFCFVFHIFLVIEHIDMISASMHNILLLPSISHEFPPNIQQKKLHTYRKL